jgi:hypothetical protein
MATFPQWEYDLLKALGAPPSQNNLTALNLWAQSEGSVTNNPLATSGRGKGATKCVAQCGGTSPIYEYDTEADGVAQMSGFLKGSYYTAIVRAFAQDAGLAAIFQAINSSPWCKCCQNGQYPIDLSQAVGGKAPGTSPSVGTGSGGTAAGGGGSSSGSNLSQCVIQLPGFLFFSGPCFLTKGGVKWLSGVAALMAGSAIGMFGVVLLAAYGFDRSGAKQAAGKVAKTVGIGGALLAGQPEVAAGVAATSRRSAPRQAPASAASEPATAGRRESRQIERRFRETERQQGPIGPRGGNPTSTRVAARERRGTSVPGAPRSSRRGGTPMTEDF